MSSTKSCIGCDAVKELDDFFRDSRRKDGRRARCKSCESEWYENNRGKVAERKKRYNMANKAKVAERDRQYREANGDKIAAYRQRYLAGLTAAIFDHYGRSCQCCGTSERLTIDHIAGDGAAHRKELFGDERLSGDRFYIWIVANHFPDGLQAMCHPCNTSKGSGERCRLNHYGS